MFYKKHKTPHLIAIPTYFHPSESKKEPTTNQYNEYLIYVDELFHDIKVCHISCGNGIEKLIYSIRSGLYPAIMKESVLIVKELELFIKHTRHIRKLLRKMGFKKLQTLNRTRIISELVSFTEDIQQGLTFIRYKFVSNEIFNVGTGDEVLSKYIDIFDSLNDSNRKWLDKFFVM